jgi:hypothetical protein
MKIVTAIVSSLVVAFVVHAGEQGAISALRSKTVEVGMTYEQVIQLRGRHFRHYPGPAFPHDVLVYDYIAVDVRDGVVRYVGPRRPEDVRSVANRPYADAK